VLDSFLGFDSFDCLVICSFEAVSRVTPWKGYEEVTSKSTTKTTFSFHNKNNHRSTLNKKERVANTKPLALQYTGRSCGDLTFKSDYSCTNGD